MDSGLGRSHRHRLQAAAAGAEEPAVRTPSSSPRRAASRSTVLAWPPAAGASDHPVLDQAADGRSPSRSPIPASASRPRSRRIIFEAFQQADASHQPQVRRHRPGPGHQPRTAAPAGRRDPAAQHARRGQHLHAVSAGDLRRPAADAAVRRRRTPPQPAADRRSAGAIRRRPVEQIADDRNAIDARATPILLIVEDDPHYARILGDLAREQGLQGAGRDPRRPTRWSCAEQYQPDRGLARRVPAGHAGLDGARASSSRIR